MAEKVKSTGDTDPQAKPATAKAEETPSSSTAPSMDEVFRVNRLLQIKDLDWKRQLQQAVTNFYLCSSGSTNLSRSYEVLLSTDDAPLLPGF